MIATGLYWEQITEHTRRPCLWCIRHEDELFKARCMYDNAWQEFIMRLTIYLLMVDIDGANPADGSEPEPAGDAPP